MVKEMVSFGETRTMLSAYRMVCHALLAQRRQPAIFGLLNCFGSGMGCADLFG